MKEASVIGKEMLTMVSGRSFIMTGQIITIITSLLLIFLLPLALPLISSGYLRSHDANKATTMLRTAPLTYLTSLSRNSSTISAKLH